MLDTSTSTAHDLETFLRLKVSQFTGTPLEDVRPDRPLIELGLDSIQLLSLGVEVEDAYGVAVDEAVLWEQPSIDALARTLQESIPSAKGASDE